MALDTNGGVVAGRLFTPYGNSRYSSGAFPGEYGFTGYFADTVTGLNYAHARYYDPAAGQFISADTVSAGGLNRYAYVGGNPETTTDPSGHCPWCIAAVIGAVVGAAISYGTQVAQNVANGGSLTDASTWTNVNWGQVGEAALVGGLVGLTGGLATAGLAAGIGAAGLSGVAAAAADAAGTVAIGAGEGALGQIGDNVIHGRNWSDGVAQAALVGAVTAGIGVGVGVGARAIARRIAQAASDGADAGASSVASEAGNDAEAGAGDTPSGSGDTASDASGDNGGEGGGGCGESFAPTTLVATPHGERTIGSLTVGTQVVAYNPATKHSSVQTVQHVFIDHDSDLLDVTLRSTPTRGPPAAHHSQHSQKQPAAAASHEETVHTTASHPWLSAARGWVRAGKLRLGERVLRADGTTATVVGLHVVSGAASMWDLTVSRVHTFAVGAGQFVVHNCEDTWAKVKKLSNGQTKAEFREGAANCQFCGRAFKPGEARIIEHAYPRSLALQANPSQEVYDQFVQDVDIFSVVCNSCNAVKGAKLPGEFRVSGGGVEGLDDMLSQKITTIASRYNLPNPLADPEE